MIWSGNCSGNVGGYDIDMVNADIGVQKIDMGEGNLPGKVDRIATVETLKENSERVSLMGPK